MKALVKHIVIKYSSVSVTNSFTKACNCYHLVGPPSRPSKPSVEKVQLTAFRLTSTVESAGSGPITHCMVNVTSNGMSVKVVNVTAAVSSADGSAVQVQATVSGLEKNVYYQFSMAAGGPYGHGEFSDLSDPQVLGLCITCV